MNREDIICPGETIKELLETYNYTPQDLANKLNMEYDQINELINGKVRITEEIAKKLELVFDIDVIN